MERTRVLLLENMLKIHFPHLKKNGIQEKYSNFAKEQIVAENIFYNNKYIVL